jgi:hypothetical protein
MRGVGVENAREGAEIRAPAGGRRMLVVLRAINMDRITEGFLRCALDAGHTVHVALENWKDRGGRAEGEQTLFDVLATEYPHFSYGALPAREDLWLHTATKLRCAIDFLRYFEPEFAEAENLRKRARSRAPWYVRLPSALGVFRIGPVRRATDRFLRAVERRMPISEQSLTMIREFDPDVVIVSPLIETGSPQGDHLRAADRLGIPTVLVVSSWDNLTTKGVIRDAPDTTIVWNGDQVREAVELHGLAPESVVATGAHSHDHWFSWQPSTGAEEFAAKVGLAPDRPFLLYVCSSGFIAGDDEVEFVREWHSRLEASGDPVLESLGVLVRPHPQNFPSWRDADLDQPGRIVVWPRGGVAPTDRQSKDDYFDSLYHAKAVVGINTSALVDSAIVRRPVFTLVGEQFRSTQTGTLHFSYLAREEGAGLLNVANSWEEHFEQLGAALQASDGHRERIDSFLRAFIRPQGLERPAAPLALDAITRTAEQEKQPVSEGGPIRWIVGATARTLGRLHLVRERLRPRALRRRMQRWRRKMRRRRGRAQRPAGARQRAAAGGARATKDLQAARQAKAERAALKQEKAERAKNGPIPKSPPRPDPELAARPEDADAPERESAKSSR